MHSDRFQQHGVATLRPSAEAAPEARAFGALASHEARAPRYTSYPTAVQFGADVDQQTYRRWLSNLAPADEVSLYVHVPLCTRLCWYCGCNTRAVTRRSAVREYVDYLAGEIALLREALPARLPAPSVHLGGGTPNVLAPEDLDRLFAALNETFALDEKLVVAAELDPASLSEAWVRAAARHGLSRASLGVQELSPDVQAAVNRIEPFEVVERAVEWLRAAGVASVNLDLMYGLPRQTTADVLHTLEAVLRLRPDRLALFGYAHVPWMKPHQRLIDERTLPGPRERLDQAAAAAERLAAEGYVRIGLDHFALPDDGLASALAEGRLRRNFQGYTTDNAPTLIGVGASAISRLPEGYVQNLTQEVAWRAALDRGELPIARGVELTGEDRFRGEIIERLMCDLRVDLDAVCRRHGRSIEDLAPELDGLATFRRIGLARLENGVLSVSEAGRPVVRSLAVLFDAYFADEPNRHARAV